MKRELKFRAWDTRTGEMSPEFSLFGEFTLMGAVHAWQEETSKINGDSIGRLNDLEIMQWTGLKDKNGKEIYEGDILEIEAARAVVVFWERPPEFGLDYSHNEDVWCDDWNLSDDSERMEVIGNIYQDKELLDSQPTIKKR